MCHISVYAYWGWYWPPVYDYAWLLVAQIVFAYAFDMLLSWSRRGSYVLGFGPFPIIFSTNLFLWFRDDWFYLQFILVAVGFLGKEFVRWHRDGRLVHIFNPSGFSLSLFSVALIATGTTHLTWGPEIASTLSLAPHIYVFLFGIGLVVMYFFSVTLVAASAAATLFGLSALYQSMTGVPYFLDSEIPSAVFLGLHLLVTDPSTSPRTPLGRLFFGILYGLGVFGLYSLLGAHRRADLLRQADVRAAPEPERAADRPRGGRDREAAPSCQTLRLDGPLGKGNLAHMGAWVVFFALMTAAGRTDGRHIGDSLPFWQQACEDGPAERVPASAAGRAQLLRRQLGMGVQRARCPLRRGQARARPIATIALGFFCARVRAAVPGGVRQPARRPRGQPRAAARLRPEAAVCGGRPQPPRHARAGSLRAGLRAWLDARVRQRRSASN